MSEDQAAYNVQKKRGGVRVPGPGKELGRPNELEDVVIIKLYLPRKTVRALEAIHKNRSKAVRILTNTDD